MIQYWNLNARVTKFVHTYQRDIIIMSITMEMCMKRPLHQPVLALVLGDGGLCR